MNTCANCGTPYDGYACPRCGTFSGQNQAPQQNRMCLGCGTQISAGFNNCPHCGRPAGQQAPQYSQPAPQYQPAPGPYQPPVYAPMPPAPPKSGGGKVILVIAVVIIVIIASLAAAFIFLMATNPFNDATEIFDRDTVFENMAGSGMDDLYKIKLGTGDVVKATLNGASGTDFDLYIYENVLFWDQYIITGSATDSSIEELTFVAWEIDYYIIDVYSYEGSGDYTLIVDIIDNIDLDDGDNSISEATPIDSEQTKSNTVNEYYDQDDYYYMYLNQGEILYAFLEVPVQVNTDFDLFVYSLSGSELAVSEAAYGNEQISLYATFSGNYYIDIMAYDGIGIYSLYAESTEGTGTDYNNDLATAEPVNDGAYIESTINQYDDRDDYYSIYISAGQTLTATMNGPDNTDFDLYIYDENGDQVASSTTATSYETVVYTAYYSGYYYINPYAYSGFGDYSLEVDTGGGGSMLNADAGYDMNAMVGQTVGFNGGDSSGAITSYSWNFGDGATGSGSSITHSYSSTGTYTVTLTVSDGSITDTDTVSVNVVEEGSLPNKYALVIGISDYDGDSDLTYCDEDADSWTAYLEGQGYIVHTLIDSQASSGEIMDEIDWLEGQEQAGDYVAFVFSGHGSYSDRTRSSSICAWNIQEEEGFITDAQLGEAFANFESQHIFFFFDSCHSGGMDSIAGPGRYVSQTCGQLEYGLDAPKHQHGMWVYWFLEYGLLDQGNMDMTRAFDAAYPRAVADAASVGNEMHPEEEFDGATFFL